MKQKTSHIFDFPLSGVRFHCYRQHLCSAYSFDFTDKGIEELWTHRTNESHTVFYRSLCDVDSYMPCYSLEYLTEAQIKMTRHQRWLAAGVQMLFFKGKCHRIQFYARLTAHSGLTGAIHKLGMATT